MSTMRGKAVTGVLLALVLLASVVYAHDPKEHKKPKPDESAAGHSHEMSEIHGGRVTMTPDHHFEVLFTPEEARVYLYDKVQQPIEAGDGVSVSMVLMRKGGDEVSLEMELMPPKPESGRVRGYFGVPHEFGDVEMGQMKAIVRVAGLAKEPIEFKTPVVVSEAASYACPMNCVAPALDPMACPKCGMQMVRKGAGKNSHGGHH